jgi:hypothetical protein
MSEELDDESRARRAEPVRCFYGVLNESMTNNDVDGFPALWRSLCKSFRPLADDVMYCFDRVVDDPPPDLVEKYKEATGYALNHVDGVSYVRGLRDQMRRIYDTTPGADA